MIFFPLETWDKPTIWLVDSMALGMIAISLIAARRVLTMLVSQDRRRRNQCIVCGYDLRASHERCPECGLPLDR
jgi:hypothetical protein